MTPSPPTTSDAVGHYAVEPDTGSWWWSAAAHRLHGVEPEQVRLTHEVVASFYDPDDWQRWWSMVLTCAWRGSSFGVQVPLTRADGAVRWVTISGERSSRGGGDHAVVVRGQLVDVTGAHDRAVAERTDEQLATALASRQVIDQAKGALMLAYGLDSDTSFDLLRWYSQHGQTKLAVLAGRLVAAVSDGLELRSLTRTQLDDALQGLLEPQVRHPAPAHGPPELDAGAGLRVRVEESAGGAGLVEVVGEVDLATVADFSSAVSRAELLVSPPHPLVVDLRGVRYLGSSAVSVLVAAHRRCGRAGTPLQVVVGHQLEVLDSSSLQGLTVSERPGGDVGGGAGGAGRGA